MDNKTLQSLLDAQSILQSKKHELVKLPISVYEIVLHAEWHLDDQIKAELGRA